MNSKMKSKLAVANKAGKMFLTKENKNLYEYDNVCFLYGEAEKFEINVCKVWVDSFEFFIKANLKNAGAFFDILQFEKIYDEFVYHINVRDKTKEFVKQIEQKYNKQDIVNEFRKKLEEVK